MVQITKHFYINSDENNFIVIEKSIAQKGKNKGKEVETIYGYYTTFEMALYGIQKALIRKCVRKYDMDLQEALERIETINNKILQISKS